MSRRVPRSALLRSRTSQVFGGGPRGNRCFVVDEEGIVERPVHGGVELDQEVEQAHAKARVAVATHHRPLRSEAEIRALLRILTGPKGSAATRRSAAN